jgi:hypothetical protein
MSTTTIVPVVRELQWSPTATGTGSTAILSSATTTLMADVVPEERHEDEMEITQHPVEQGSVISDHAFKLPARLDLTYGWAGGSLQNTAMDPNFLKLIYAQLLQLQANATLFVVYTGKRTYRNMMIRTLAVTTDKESENILLISIGLQEILMAVTTAITIAANQALPQKTSPVQNLGPTSLQPAPTYNSGSGN